MKKSFFHLILFAVLIFSCSCLRKKSLPDFPKKDLVEHTVYGWYLPEDPGRVEKAKQKLIERGKLKKGEDFSKKFPEILDDGDEDFGFSSASYCYNVEKDKNPIYREDLRIRLYDKNGLLLAEDFLRLSSPDYYDEEGRYSDFYMDRYYFIRDWIPSDSKSREEKANSGILDYRSIRGHLPYHLEGHKYRIVRMEGDKEIVLHKSGILKKSYLIQRYSPERGAGIMGWFYDEENHCHYSPPIR